MNNAGALKGSSGESWNEEEKYQDATKQAFLRQATESNKALKELSITETIVIILKIIASLEFSIVP